MSAVEATKDESRPEIPNPNHYQFGLGDVSRGMEKSTTSLPSFGFRRSHLDSYTYRSFTRILTRFLDHTANTTSQPPPPPSASGIHGTVATAIDDTSTQQHLEFDGRGNKDSLGMDHLSNNVKQGEDFLNMDGFSDSISFNDNIDQEQLLTIHKDFSDCISPQFQQQQQQKHEDVTYTSDVELEDGEILKEPGDVVRLSYLENCRVGEMGDGKDKDKLIEEIVEERNNFDRHTDETVEKLDDLNCIRGPDVVKGNELDCGHVSSTCKEDDIAGHDFTRNTYKRNNPPIVDYSDLYCTDPAAFKGNMLHHTSKGGKGRGTRKKDTCDKPHKSRVTKEKNGSHSTPSNDKSRVTKENNGSHCTPLDSCLYKSISMKEPIQNLDKESNSMVNKIVEMKKKKGPLTEERKVKKKQAKKRKRAEQNRKLGVKRLKIEPIIKPKKVVYCDFYLKGKCQKGNLCTFSHDTIPLTKSQPCKYFASESCLKGDDCPFDHDLSKYPCHNFMSNGTCSRGETCKFSHKLSDANNSFVSKSDSLWSSKEQPNNTSLVSALDNSPEKVAFCTSRSLHTHLEEQREGNSMKVPEGISFISFGNKMSGENLEKNQCSEKHFVDRKTSCLNNDKPEKTTNNIPTTATQKVEQLTNMSIMKVPRGIQVLSFNKDIAEEVKKRSDGINQDKAPTLSQNVNEVSLGSPALFSTSPQNNKLPVDVQYTNGKWGKELHSRGGHTSRTGAEKATDLNVSPTGPKESIINYSSKLFETSSKSISNDVTDASKILEEFLFCGSTT